MKESKRSETVDIKREDRFHEKNLKKVFYLFTLQLNLE
jgi:hypothetical protein